jgi:GNAT superfamily N-acetyltransferase
VDRPRPLVEEASVAIVPANEASWDDLRAIFGDRGYTAYCQCQKFKIGHHEWTDVPVALRMERLREETHCGYPSATTTSGLVAYLDGEPVGWCAIEPRTAYPRLPPRRVAWEARGEDKDDDGVWAVTCFVTRAGFRRRGISRALAHATVAFARERGARALESYPMNHGAGSGDHLGRGPRRQPKHLRRCRVPGGQPSDPQAGRDADRLPGTSPFRDR